MISTRKRRNEAGARRLGGAIADPASDDRAETSGATAARAYVARLADHLRAGAVLFDPLGFVGTTVDPNGATVIDASMPSAALAIVWGETAAERGAEHLLRRALGLCRHIHAPSLRVSTLGALCAEATKLALASSGAAPRVALLDQLGDELVRLPTDSCLTESAVVHARAARDFARLEAAAPGRIVAARSATLARRAVQLATRLDEPAALAGCLSMLKDDLTRREQARCILDFADRAFVRALAPWLTIEQRRSLREALAASHWAARAVASASADSRRRLADLARELCAAHAREHVACLRQQRLALLDALRECSTRAWQGQQMPPDSQLLARARDGRLRFGDLDRAVASAPDPESAPDFDSDATPFAALPALDHVAHDIIKRVLPPPEAMRAGADREAQVRMFDLAHAELCEWFSTGDTALAAQVNREGEALVTALERASAATQPLPDPLTAYTSLSGALARARTVVASFDHAPARNDALFESQLWAALVPPGLSVHAASALAAYCASGQRLILALLIAELAANPAFGTALCERALRFWRRLRRQSPTLNDETTLAAALVLSLASCEGSAEPTPPFAAHALIRLFAELGRDAAAAAVQLTCADPKLGRLITTRLVATQRLVFAKGGHGASTGAAWLLAVAPAVAPGIAFIEAGTNADATVGSASGSGGGDGGGNGAGAVHEVESHAGTGGDTDNAAIARRDAVARLTRLLGEQGLPKLCQRIGRTLVFADQDHLVAIKLQRADEPRAALEHEMAMLAAKRRLNPASDLPRPLGVYRPASPLAENHRVALRAAGIALATTPHGLMYEVPAADVGYFRYVTEVPTRQRRAGLHKAARDLFAWLRAGDVHAALSAKNHSLSVDATRRYEWMIDACFVPLLRRGMGRLDRVELACRFPNVRASGVADLAELGRLEDSMADCARRRDEDLSTPDPVPGLHAHPKAVTYTLHVARVLGDYLLDLSLLAAVGHRQSRRAARQSALGETSTRALALELTSLWTLSAATFIKRPATQTRAWLAACIDFRALARQLLYFLSPEGFARDCAAGLASPTPEVATGQLVERLRRELYTPALALSVDLVGSAAQFVGPRDPTGCAKGFCADGEHYDLGLYNGPWPLLELERGLYVAAAYMLTRAARPQTSQGNTRPGRDALASKAGCA